MARTHSQGSIQMFIFYASYFSCVQLYGRKCMWHMCNGYRSLSRVCFRSMYVTSVYIRHVSIYTSRQYICYLYMGWLVTWFKRGLSQRLWWEARGGGGGGVLGIYIGGGLAHQKGGVLGAGTAPKKGGLRCGHNQKKGGLRHVYNPNKREFRTDFVKRDGVRNWSCSKGGLGSLFMYYLYFYLSKWSTSGGVFWQAEKGGLRCGHS